MHFLKYYHYEKIIDEIFDILLHIQCAFYTQMHINSNVFIGILDLCLDFHKSTI